MTAAERLRKLVRDYSHGLVPHDDYRQARAKILAGLDGPDEDEHATVPRSEVPTAPSALSATTKIDTVRSKLTGALPADAQQRRILAAAAVALLALAVTFLIAWIFGSASDDANPVGGPGIVDPAAVDGDELLRAFLDRDDWSPASAKALLTAWWALQPEERVRVRGTTAFLSFENELRARIRTERNLANSDQDIARLEDGEPLLRTLAVELGFDGLVATEFGQPTSMR